MIAEFLRRRGIKASGASWVNRLSWADYESRMQMVGFRLRTLRFTGRPIDEDFYRRFASILGRYPRTDLARDFFEVVLEKPAGPVFGGKVGIGTQLRPPATAEVELRT